MTRGVDLIGLSRAELTAAVTDLGEPAFRARQLWHWIYHRGERDFAAMSSLSKAFRARLGGPLHGRPARGLAGPAVGATAPASGCCATADRHEVECVHIPEEERGTLCVSSQVGCTLTCRFCHTGTQRLVRNLSAAEIVGQVMQARDDFERVAGAVRTAG